MNLRAAGFQCGKGIIFNGTDGGINHNPLEILRQLCCVTGAADAADREGQAAANRQIIGIRGNQSMVKCIGGLRRGNYQQGGANRTLISIRGTVHNRDLVRSLLLGSKGRGASAVQINRDGTAGFQHDLGNLLGAAAGREGLLPSIQHHHDHFSVAGDAYTGAGSSGIVVVRIGADCNLSVLDQEYAAAHGLLDLILVCCVVAGAANNGRSILQNTEEVLAANAMVLHALHDQCAAGNAGTHVIEVRVDAQNRIVVFYVVVRVSRIRVPGLSRSHLIGNSGHGPGGSVIIIIVRVDADVLTADVDSSCVEHDLLVFSGQRVGNILGDAGCNGAGGIGEHGIVAVLRPIRFRLRVGFRCRVRVGSVFIARKLKQIVRKRIAAGSLQGIVILQIKQFVGTFQCPNQGVRGVGIQNSLTDTRFCLNIAQTVLEKIRRAALIAERTGEIALQNRADAVATAQFAGNIESVHITIDVGGSKGVINAVQRCIIRAQVLFTDGIRQNIHIGFTGVHLVRDVHIFGAVHHIGGVASPAAHICAGLDDFSSHALDRRIISDVQSAEHMAQVNQVSVGQRELLQVFQRGSGSTICNVLLGHIFREGRILRAGQCCPGAGGVPFHACTDEVNHQRSGILRGIVLGILGSVALQLLQVSKECGIVGHRRQLGRIKGLRRSILFFPTAFGVCILPQIVRVCRGIAICLIKGGWL